MGYSTDFTGGFDFSKPLSQEQCREFNTFCQKRHGGPAKPFEGSPGFWCNWETDGDSMFWCGAEKTYDMVEWGNVLLERFLTPWGVSIIGGEMIAHGERRDDVWKIVFRDGEFKKVSVRVVYEEIQ